MSWEVLLLRLPDHVTSMEGLRGEEGTPPLGPKPWVLDAVRRVLPESDLTNPKRGHAEGPGWSIELIFGFTDPVDSIMLQVRGNHGDALAPIFRLAAELSCRVLDVFCENLITPLDFQEELRGRFTEAEWRAPMAPSLPTPAPRTHPNRNRPSHRTPSPGKQHTTRRAGMNDKTTPGTAAGPTWMANRRPALCHLKRPAQLTATPPGRDACHGTATLEDYSGDLYVSRTYIKEGQAPGGGALAMSQAKSARINLRLNPESLETIRAAASVQQQDLTSFVLGVAMERARAVLTEDRLLRLTLHEVNQLERALDSEPEVVPQLKAFIRRLSEGSDAVSG